MSKNIYDVLKRPIITEKSNFQTEKLGQVVFEVAQYATKSMVKEAVETIFDRLAEAFLLMYNDPMLPLELAIMLATIRLLRTNRRRVASDYSSSPVALSLPAWAVVSVSLFVTMAAGLPTLYWFSFSAWLQSGRM